MSYQENETSQENQAISSETPPVRKRTVTWKISEPIRVDESEHGINFKTPGYERPFFPTPGQEHIKREDVYPSVQENPVAEETGEGADVQQSEISDAPTKPKAKFGTRELSDSSENILNGCSNNCKYCYSAERALSSGRIKSRVNWKDEQLKSDYRIQGPLQFKKYDGVVMYPTSHDITRCFLNSHVKAVTGLLAAGNDLLICSKASLYCMKKIAAVCKDYQDKVTFMVTITTLDEAQSVFWEENAPLPCDRIAALTYLYNEGFQTSVIIEPLLQGPSSAMAIYEAVLPYVTDSIWIGTMNSADKRVDASNPENVKAVEAIKRYHSIDNLRFLYDSMKDLPKVKFKSSITRIFEKKAE